MPKIVFGLIIAALTLSQGVIADEQLRAECQRYAMEDKVPAEEMEQYMKDCMGVGTEGAPEAPLPEMQTDKQD